MRRWKETPHGPEQRRAVRDALAAVRNDRAKAARLLGISRSHLYRLLKLGVLEGVTGGNEGDTRDTRDTRDTSEGRDTTSPVSSVSSVSRSRAFSSTYGGRVPTLPAVASTAPIDVADPAEKFSSPRLTGDARAFARRVSLEVEELTGRTEALSLTVELMVLHFKRTSGGDPRAVAEQLLEATRADVRDGTEGE
jgi:regulatory Fis family protein